MASRYCEIIIKTISLIIQINSNP